MFFLADIILMFTMFLFSVYCLLFYDISLGIIEGVVGAILLGLCVMVLCKGSFLKAASWILVCMAALFMLYSIFFYHFDIVHIIWLIVPYFLAMFLLGLPSGLIVSLVFAAGVVAAIITHIIAGDYDLTWIKVISVSIANLFAVLFAAYYEKERTENEAELLQKNREIEILSNHDGLTGLFNRRYFDRAFHNEFFRALREHQPLALLIGDIDYFKNYNDSFGHLQGDSCLVEVADAIRSSINRTTDAATRYGGEEFAILLPNTNLKGAMIVAHRISEKMLEKGIPHPLSDVAKTVTLSLGVSVIEQDTDREPSDLVNRADRALYTSKFNGRNRITNL